MSGIVAGINAGIALTTMGISAGQKRKAEKKAAEAEQAAQKAMDEARAKLDVNFQEGRTISKDPYTMAIEASPSQGAASVQAAQEAGARGIAQVGRIQMAQNQMAEEQRVGLGQELQQLDKDIRDEDSRLRDVQTQIDLQEAAGAQEAAAMYDEQAAAAKAAMIQSGIDAAAAGASALPLYSQNRGQQRATFAEMGNQGATGSQAVQNAFAGATPDYAMLGSRGKEARQYRRNLTPQQRQALLFDPSYMSTYNTLFPTQ